MGLINMCTKKCVFCGNSKDTKYIPAFGEYNGILPGNWYHRACLMEIVCEPEQYSHRVVDMAVDIIDRIKTQHTSKMESAMETVNKFRTLRKVCV